MSRAELGADGNTGYERSKEKMAKLSGMEFGEGMMWKRRIAGGPLGELSCMWDDGIYLGVKGTTGDMIVGNKDGLGGLGRSEERLCKKDGRGRTWR